MPASLGEAAVVYSFEFSNLRPLVADHPPISSFSLQLEYPDYVETTGFRPLDEGLATPLGYEIIFAGTNRLGWWEFDEDSEGVLTDEGSTGIDGGLLFGHRGGFNGYVTSPGRYAGFATGSTRREVEGGITYTSFLGDAVLTVSETDVPEPAAMGLLGLSVAGLASMRRRKPPAAD
jgi:hypothetical protein